MLIERKRYLDKLIIRKHNGFIKVITGIRRCGKSYLLNNLFYNHLIEEGVNLDHIIRFAFDSADDLSLIGESLIDIDNEKRKVDPVRFMSYISSKINDQNIYYLLLDEVQNLGSFESVLNGYLRKENLDIYVTCSSSKFLSSDVITEFEGRGDEIHVLPLSFKEFYQVYNGNIDEAFDEYSLYGGLPAICSLKTEEQKIMYLSSQLKNVYLKDILVRYHLNNNDNIDELLNILASGISTLVNPSKLANTFKSVKNSSISSNTISSYIKYLKESYLISCVQRYDVKGKKYINTPFKIYFEDIGLRNAKLNFRQVEQTHIMENIIYNELRYRGYNVDVGMVESYENDKDGNRVKRQREIDFVANLGSKRYYIQSSYEIFSEGKFAQETKPFDKINDSFKKVIIVYQNIKPRRSEKGYLVIGLKDFLLNENSLDQ